MSVGAKLVMIRKIKTSECLKNLWAFYMFVKPIYEIRSHSGFREHFYIAFSRVSGYF